MYIAGQFLDPSLVSCLICLLALLNWSVHHPYINTSRGKREVMADWGPVVIAVVLFVLLTPGLLFQLPGKSRAIEFANMQTSGVSILVHTIIFFGLITIFLIAIGVHITTGWLQLTTTHYYSFPISFLASCMYFLGS